MHSEYHQPSVCIKLAELLPALHMMADPRIESLERMLEKGHISADQYIQGLAALTPQEETPAAVVATPALRSAAQARRARKNAKKRVKKKAKQAAALWDATGGPSYFSMPFYEHSFFE